jgi:parallel beta-helix repeat protein
MKKSVFCSVMVCFLVFSFSATAGDVIRVPKDFGTIQQAIDAAPTDAIIQVAAGTYCENLVIARSDVRLHAAPSGRVVLSGSCAPDAIGIFIIGSPTAPVSNVEVMGFVVEDYEAGILLGYVTDSRLHRNVVQNNVSGPSPTLGGAYTGQGILLAWSDFNEVVQNISRGNGHLGVGIVNGSNNLVRGNRIIDNVADHALLHRWCSVMFWGTSTGNRFVENEVTGETGMGVMLGSGPASGNLVAQNRIHGHAFEGIWATASTFGNIITQNDARGNALHADAIRGLFGYDAYDLDDWSEGANTWRRNLGSCPPDSGLCRE